MSPEEMVIKSYHHDLTRERRSQHPPNSLGPRLGTDVNNEGLRPKKKLAEQRPATQVKHNPGFSKVYNTGTVDIQPWGLAD